VPAAATAPPVKAGPARQPFRGLTTQPIPLQDIELIPDLWLSPLHSVSRELQAHSWIGNDVFVPPFSQNLTHEEMLNMYVSRQRINNWNQAALPDRNEAEHIREMRYLNYGMHLQLRKNGIVIQNLLTLTQGIYFQMHDIPHLTWKPVDYAMILNNGRFTELRKMNRGINLELVGYQIPSTYDGGHGPGLSMKCFYLKGLPDVYSHARLINTIQEEWGPLSIYYPELIDEYPFRNTGIVYVKFVHLDHAKKFLRRCTSQIQGGGINCTDGADRFSKVFADPCRLELVAPFGPDNLRNDKINPDMFAGPGLEQLAYLSKVVRPKGSRGCIYWDELMDHRFVNEKALELWWDEVSDNWHHDSRYKGTTFAMSKAEASIYDRPSYQRREARSSTPRR
jgi:hypothetical protein